MTSRPPTQKASIRSISDNLYNFKSHIGYFIAGFATAFAFVGVCLMSCDSRLRQQEGVTLQFQNESYPVKLMELLDRHGNSTNSTLTKRRSCTKAAARLDRLHDNIGKMEKLAQPSFVYAGLRWVRYNYFERRIAQPIMCMFLISTIIGIICLLIVVISNTDSLTSITKRSSSYISRRPREPAKPGNTSDSLNTVAQNQVPERIPRCYKLKELESDLESITRLELDDQDAGNHYVYGPWRVYCESRDGSVAK